MARSAGLALYLASRSLAGKARPKPGASGSDPPPRPEGALVWFHAGSGARPEAIAEVARRLVRKRPGSHAVVSSESAFSTEPPPPLFAVPPPEDAPKAVKAFLDHWKPDCVVMAGELHLPAVIAEAQARSVPQFLVDARMTGASARTLRWAAIAGAPLLAGVSRILTGTETDAAPFRKLRLPPDRIEVVGFLEEGTAPVPCNESDRSALAALVATRPVWLAAPIGADELDDVLAAHSRASRNAHRLLLILAPARPEDGADFARRVEQAGWQVALRSEGREPDADVQVYLADVPDEMGLWYRLAPISFLGNSLAPSGTGHNPYEPAALGSAILTGPRTGPYRPIFARFLGAGAARTVSSADMLGDTLAELLAPDRTAEMARRAWEITSAGAEVTDRLLALLAEVLDERATP